MSDTGENTAVQGKSLKSRSRRNCVTQCKCRTEDWIVSKSRNGDCRTVDWIVSKSRNGDHRGVWNCVFSAVLQRVVHTSKSRIGVVNTEGYEMCFQQFFRELFMQVKQSIEIVSTEVYEMCLQQFYRELFIQVKQSIEIVSTEVYDMCLQQFYRVVCENKWRLTSLELDAKMSIKTTNVFVVLGHLHGSWVAGIERAAHESS